MALKVDSICQEVEGLQNSSYEHDLGDLQESYVARKGGGSVEGGGG